MADPLDLSTFNLNLLLSLEALLEERGVTRAAKRLGITQSAMSHNLASLRDLLGDTLLIRNGSKMELSSRAREILPPLSEALKALKASITISTDFDPLKARRTFRVATGDHLMAELAPQLARELEEKAPQIDVVMRPLAVGDTQDILVSGEAELAIGPKTSLPADMRTRWLRKEEFVCAARKGHPLFGETPSLENYLKARHLLISPLGRGDSFIDKLLEAEGHQRQISLRVPSFLLAPLVVAESNMVVTAPGAVLEAWAERLELSIYPPPIELASFDLVMAWPGQYQLDSGHQWLRRLIHDLMSSSH